MEEQENDEELHGNLRNDLAGSSSTEGVEVGANDFTAGLPDEILSHVLSFLSMGEAARTSTLSRRWRYLWARSLSLNFDLENMALSNARRKEHLEWLITGYGPHLRQADATLLRDMKLAFVAWVNRVLNLHDSAKIVSFRVNFPLLGEYDDNVVQWIRHAAAKGVEKLHLILADAPIVLHRYDRCDFPFWVFAQADGSCSLKHLQLDYCSFNPPTDFCSFRNLISLSLRKVPITQYNLDSIFGCMMLEYFSMSFCIAPDKLRIAGGSAYIRLKDLKMSMCLWTREVEICDAPSLLSFEHQGSILVKLLLKNSANPLKLSFHPCLDIEEGYTYTFRQLSFDFPEVKTLLFGYISVKGFEIPKVLPTFGNLKELVLILEDMEIALKMTKIFLMASPLLHRLEVNLPTQKTSTMPNYLDIENLFEHNYLKEVKIFNFHGVPFQLQLAIYLVKVAAALERMTIVRRGQLYKGNFKWIRSTSEPEVTKDQALELFRGVVPASLEFTVF